MPITKAPPGYARQPSMPGVRQVPAGEQTPGGSVLPPGGDWVSWLLSLLDRPELDMAPSPMAAMGPVTRAAKMEGLLPEVRALIGRLLRGNMPPKEPNLSVIEQIRAPHQYPPLTPYDTPEGVHSYSYPYHSYPPTELSVDTGPTGTQQGLMSIKGEAYYPTHEPHLNWGERDDFLRTWNQEPPFPEELTNLADAPPEASLYRPGSPEWYSELRRDYEAEGLPTDWFPGEGTRPE